MREMKESKIQWLGKIPKNWHLIKGKYLFALRTTRGNHKRLKLLSPTQQYGVISQDEYEKLSGMKAVKLKQDTDLSSLRTIHKGDYCISLRSFQGGFEYCNQEGVVSPAYQVFYPTAPISHDYYRLLFKNDGFIAEMNSFTMSLRDGKNIAFKDFGDSLIPYPNLQEQQDIADYLDAKCADIDALQQDLQAEIETLQAYKKSLITRAVTKGLDPHVEMKDSRIPWVKRIPKHWEVKRLKFIMDNFDYERIPVDATKRNQDSDQLYDYYGASGIIDKIDGYTSEGTRILIGEDGANLVLRNLPVIYIAHGKYWVNNHAHILAPKENGNLYFYAYQMECVDYTEYITGSAQPKLSQKNLGQVYLVVPPINEQNTIAGYLDSKCSEIDSIIASKQKQSEILSDYKKSLIYEMVTGKKEVPVHE